MAFSITHVLGDMDKGTEATDFSALLAELVGTDAEHGDVAVVHESGWGLSAYRNGNVVFEDVEGRGGRWHMRSVPAEKTITLMRQVAVGALDDVPQEDWQPGYPT